MSETTSPPPPSDPCYCVSLRKATRRLSARYDAALAPVGITVAQFSLLRAIRRTPRLSLTDLADRTELDRSTNVISVLYLSRLLNHGNPWPT